MKTDQEIQLDLKSEYEQSTARARCTGEDATAACPGREASDACLGEHVTAPHTTVKSEEALLQAEPTSTDHAETVSAGGPSAAADRASAAASRASVSATSRSCCEDDCTERGGVTGNNDPVTSVCTERASPHVSPSNSDDEEEALLCSKRRRDTAASTSDSQGEDDSRGSPPPMTASSSAGRLQKLISALSDNVEDRGLTNSRVYVDIDDSSDNSSLVVLLKKNVRPMRELLLLCAFF